MKADVVVIGGGLAGASAAITLAQGGCDVLLVEREAKPVDKVCGEFLSREALVYLRALGVDVAALGGVEIDRVRLAGAGKVSECALPFTAMSLTRRRLDEEMLRVAEGAGVRVVRGVSAVRAGNRGQETGNRGNAVNSEQLTADSVEGEAFVGGAPGVVVAGGGRHPQGLKPGFLRGNDVRAEARTLQSDSEFVRAEARTLQTDSEFVRAEARTLQSGGAATAGLSASAAEGAAFGRDDTFVGRHGGCGSPLIAPTARDEWATPAEARTLRSGGAAPAGLSAAVAEGAAFGRDDRFVGGHGGCGSPLIAPSARDEWATPASEEGRWVKLSSGVEVEAGAVFLATGKHDLRGWARPPGRQNGLVAMKMYWRLTAKQTDALRGHVELMTYRGGYTGLQLVEQGVANLCSLVEREELKRLGGRWEGLLRAMMAQSPHLRERLEGAEALLEKPVAVASIPYGMVRERADGVWCVGDQAAVIPSFTGDGMSIALHSGVLAARMYLGGADAEAFQRKLRGQLSRQVGFATVLSRGLVAWPGAMCAVARIWPGCLQLVARGTRISRREMVGGRCSL